MNTENEEKRTERNTEGKTNVGKSKEIEKGRKREKRANKSATEKNSR
jgi:hypothetical protein